MNSAAALSEQVYGLKAFVEAHFPGYCRTVEARIGGGLVLPDVEEHVVGYKDLNNSHIYPFACYVLGPGTADPSANHAQRLSVAVEVGIAFQSSKPDLLEQQLIAYADAFLDMIGDHEDLEGTCDLAWVEGFDPAHGALADKSTAALVFTIRMEKEVPTG